MDGAIPLLAVFLLDCWLLPDQRKLQHPAPDGRVRPALRQSARAQPMPAPCPTSALLRTCPHRGACKKGYTVLEAIEGWGAEATTKESMECPRGGAHWPNRHVTTTANVPG